MLDPVTASALIGAGSSLLGGLFNRNDAKKQAQRNENLQREFAQNSIRWRVSDAKAAGLHPLYALGGGGATYSPAPIQTHLGSALQSAGQDLARAAAAPTDTGERAIREAQLKALDAAAQKDLAAAQLYSSQSARVSQEANASQPISHAFTSPVRQAQFDVRDLAPLAAGGTASVNPSGQGSMFESVKFKPAEVTAVNRGAPHVQAGQHGAFVEWTVGVTPNGKPVRILAPYSDEGLANSLGEMPMALWPALLKANRARYTAQETRDILDSLGFGWAGRLVDTTKIRQVMPKHRAPTASEIWKGHPFLR